MESDTPLDDTNVIEEQPTPVEADSTPEPDHSPDPVSEDAADGAIEEVEEAKPSRAQQRIQQLVGDRNHAMEFGKLQQEEATRLREQLAAREKPAETPAPAMPSLEDFDYDQDSYNVAMQAWNTRAIAEQVKAGVSEAMRLTSQTAAATQVDAEWKANLATFSAEHEDFNDVAYANEAIYDVIKTLPDGPDIAYHLGQNMEEAHRIAALPASQIPFALGRLNMSSKPVVAQKQATRAPDPMAPVGGGQPTLSHANETMEDFVARRRTETRHLPGR